MPLILPGNVGSATAATGFNVANSCRFNSASSDRLNRTLGTPTNNLKWTYSFWIKRSKLGEEVAITEALTDSQNKGIILFRSDDKLEILDLISDSYVMQKKTNRVFRDTASWYHIVFSNDSTAGSPDLKIYVNGVEETSLATDNEYSQNQAGSFNSALANHIGASASSRFSNCYFSEFVFIDGLQLAADQFGEFDSDSGIWKPIDVSGLTFGTNGFYLDFEDSSALGNDAAGSNNFTVNNLTATDQSTDTCTNNFAVLNPLNYGANYTFSEGNLQFAQSATNWDTAYSSIAVTKGKWYMEFKGKVGAYYDIGVTDVVDPTNNLTVNSGCVAYKSNGEFARAGAVGDGLPSTVTDPASNTYTADDIMGIAIDVDNEAVYFSKNGTYEVNSDPTSGASKTGAVTLPNSGSTYFFAFAAYKGGAASGTGQVNFGGGSVDAISSGNTDADGHGNFEYAVPSGYFSLCTKNLAEYG